MRARGGGGGGCLRASQPATIGAGVLERLGLLGQAHNLFVKLFEAQLKVYGADDPDTTGKTAIRLARCGPAAHRPTI